MATNNASNQKFTNNADGFDLAGGTTARKLTVSGADVAIAGSGTNVMTMPAATDTLVGRASTDTLTNKTLTSPAVNTPTLVLANTSPTADGGIGFDRTGEDLQIGDGTNSQYIHVGAWTTFTSSLTNLTIGNGTQTSSYTLIGKACFYRIYILFGSTTSISGSVTAGLPLTAATYPANAEIGTAWFRDASGPANVLGGHNITGVVFIKGVGLTYEDTANLSSTTPFTWATGDYISICGQYEIA